MPAYYGVYVREEYSSQHKYATATTAYVPLHFRVQTHKHASKLLTYMRCGALIEEQAMGPCALGLWLARESGDIV